MNILAFDTTMQACSAAVLTHIGECFSATQKIDRGHAEALMPMVLDVLNQAQMDFEDLDCVAVTLGPGAFTGVRVGVATARGLGVALDKPVYGYSTLHVMAAHAMEKSGASQFEQIVVTTDARRGELYAQVFDPELLSVDLPFITTADRLSDLVRSKATLVLGSGGAHIASAVEGEDNIKLVMPELLPVAADLVHLGKSEIGRQLNISPFYLRAPDAKPQVGKHVLRAS